MEWRRREEQNWIKYLNPTIQWTQQSDGGHGHDDGDGVNQTHIVSCLLLPLTPQEAWSEQQFPPCPDEHGNGHDRDDGDGDLLDTDALFQDPNRSQETNTQRGVTQIQLCFYSMPWKWN